MIPITKVDTMVEIIIIKIGGTNKHMENLNKITNQVAIENEDGIYFQQSGERIYGVYVNESFVEIDVKAKLSKDELKNLGIKIMDVLNSCPAIRSHIDHVKEHYEEFDSSQVMLINENEIGGAYFDKGKRN